MSNIVKVPFYGDEIEAVHDGQDVWVALRRMCENVGLAPDAQAVKLKGKGWAVMIEATGPDGKTYEMLALHLDSVPMWLATIEPSRVREDIRPKLVAYQKECARVLRDHSLRAIARVLAGDDKQVYRSSLSASHMDLRSALQFSGTGRGWSNLPLSKWSDARAELERMSRAATRSAKSRQLNLVN
jgi:hypothetical protein